MAYALFSFRAYKSAIRVAVVYPPVFVLGGCPLHCGMYSSIPGLYLLDATVPQCPLVTMNNVSRHWRVSLGGRTGTLQKKTTTLLSFLLFWVSLHAHTYLYMPMQSQVFPLIHHRYLCVSEQETSHTLLNSCRVLLHTFKCVWPLLHWWPFRFVLFHFFLVQIMLQHTHSRTQSECSIKGTAGTERSRFVILDTSRFLHSPVSKSLLATSLRNSRSHSWAPQSPTQLRAHTRSLSVCQMLEGRDTCLVHAGIALWFFPSHLRICKKHTYAPSLCFWEPLSRTESILLGPCQMTVPFLQPLSENGLGQRLLNLHSKRVTCYVNKPLQKVGHVGLRHYSRKQWKKDNMEPP